MTVGLMNMLAECEALSSKTRRYSFRCSPQHHEAVCNAARLFIVFCLDCSARTRGKDADHGPRMDRTGLEETCRGI